MVTTATASTETIGQDIDKELAVVKARLAVLEADGKTDWADVKAWFKTNAPHLVTWVVTAATAAKVGLVADVVKYL
jgi:hypothetical protein